MNTSIFCTEGRDEENSETETGLRSANKEWNFGLTEYADTVGPQGEPCRLHFEVTVDFRSEFSAKWSDRDS